MRVFRLETATPKSAGTFVGASLGWLAEVSVGACEGDLSAEGVRAIGVGAGVAVDHWTAAVGVTVGALVGCFSGEFSKP